MPPQRIAFSSNGALAGPEEAARLRRWWDEFSLRVCGIEIAVDTQMPFATAVEYVQLGAVGLGRSGGSIDRFERGPRAFARDGDDRFHLSINRGGVQALVAGGAWQAVSPPGFAAFCDYADSGGFICPDGHKVSCLFLPRKPFLRALRNAEDLLGAIIPNRNDALRLLVHYADGVMGADGPSHPAILEHAGRR